MSLVSALLVASLRKLYFISVSCQLTRTLWFGLLSIRLSCNNFSDFITWLKSEGLLYKAIIIHILINSIWQHRNTTIHEGKSFSPHNIISNIKGQCSFSLMAFSTIPSIPTNLQHHSTTTLHSFPPRTSWSILFNKFKNVFGSFMLASICYLGSPMQNFHWRKVQALSSTFPLLCLHSSLSWILYSAIHNSLDPLLSFCVRKNFMNLDNSSLSSSGSIRQDIRTFIGLFLNVHFSFVCSSLVDDFLDFSFANVVYSFM